MMAAEHHYVYTGEGKPPRSATHVTIHESITVIPRCLFCGHPNIIELICHIRVKKIKKEAFYDCALKRLVMPGVEEVEEYAFYKCDAIDHVECQKLEVIGKNAFSECTSLKSIDLSSTKIVSDGAFDDCFSLADVKFGKNLESIGQNAFCNATLKRITIPLKRGLLTQDDVFVGCEDFNQVCLHETTIHETVEALLLDEWKNDMNEEIDSINQILPNASAGILDYYNIHGDENHEGEKTKAIRDWIRRILQKIIHYKVEHYRLLSLAAAELAHASPNEIIINSVLSFLQLPDQVFEGEGDSRTTTAALDRQMWENIVQMGQSLLEKDAEIASLRALNDEKGDEIQLLKLRVAQLEQKNVAESCGAIMKNDADELSRKRPRGS